MKVVSKLDQQTYAVKQITVKKTRCLNITEQIEKLLREIRVLARTNHPNVLRYYNCWFDIVYEKNSSQQVKKLSVHENEDSDNEFELCFLDSNDKIFKIESGFNEIHQENMLFFKPTPNESLFDMKNQRKSANPLLNSQQVIFTPPKAQIA